MHSGLKAMYSQYPWGNDKKFSEESISQAWFCQSTIHFQNSGLQFQVQTIACQKLNSGPHLSDSTPHHTPKSTDHITKQMKNRLTPKIKTVQQLH